MADLWGEEDEEDENGLPDAAGEEEDEDEEDDILDMEGDGAVLQEGALLMRFCPHDSSMLYPQVRPSIKRHTQKTGKSTHNSSLTWRLFVCAVSLFESSSNIFLTNDILWCVCNGLVE